MRAGWPPSFKQVANTKSMVPFQALMNQPVNVTPANRRRSAMSLLCSKDVALRKVNYLRYSVLDTGSDVAVALPTFLDGKNDIVVSVTLSV